MSEAKFTKWPWFVEDRTVYALQDCVWLGLPSKENRFFAVVQGTKCDESEIIANTHLIAAAPEMYEMLNECYHTVSNFQLKGEIAALLAKARGKENEQ